MRRIAILTLTFAIAVCASSLAPARPPSGASKAIGKIKPALVTVQSSKTVDKPDGKKTSLKNVGVVLDPKGLVVAPLGESGLGTEVKIVLADGRNLPAKVIHADAKSGWGVFEIRDGKKLPVAEVANSDGVELGEAVLSLGSTDGSTNTVSGIVSAKDRRLEGETVLQVDSAISPGASPGILIDAKGNFLGVVVPGRDGIGLAIPSNRALTTVTNLAKQPKGK